MSAKEKDLVLKDWEAFLRSGLQQEYFTKRLYDHLIQHCSFIAHYNREGFYDTYFTNGDDKTRFLSQFDKSKAAFPGGPPNSIEYGMGYWATAPDYRDINLAMIEVATRHIPVLTQQAAHEQEEMDLTHAMGLMRKHGVQMDMSELKKRKAGKP